MRMSRVNLNIEIEKNSWSTVCLCLGRGDDSFINKRDK